MRRMIGRLVLAAIVASAAACSARNAQRCFIAPTPMLIQDPVPNAIGVQARLFCVSGEGSGRMLDKHGTRTLEGSPYQDWIAYGSEIRVQSPTEHWSSFGVSSVGHDYGYEVEIFQTRTGPQGVFLLYSAGAAGEPVDAAFFISSVTRTGGSISFQIQFNQAVRTYTLTSLPGTTDVQLSNDAGVVYATLAVAPSRLAELRAR